MLTAALAVLAMRPNDFAARLWNALPETTGNVVVSPTSLEACLGLLVDGVGPSSRPPLAKTFGVAPNELPTFETALQTRLRDLTGPEVTVSSAGFFSSPPAPAYVAALRKGYGATADRLTGTAQINAWVNGKTKGRIPKLVERLPPATEAVLLNAVTFDGDWTKAFDATKTSKGRFGSGTVDTMRAPDGRLDYAQGEGFGLVSLPYKGGRYRMVVILPDTGAPGRLLRDDAWRRALETTQNRPVDLTLPRFTVRSEPPVETAAKALGLAPLFQRLDFRPGVPSGRVARIDQIVQKTYVKVDEKGTAAAAATGIVMARSAMRPQPKVTFHVDRPFAFAIQHVATGEAVFMGVIRAL